MKFVKVAAVVMGIMILVGSGVIVVTVVKRMTSATQATHFAVVLDEPAGTRIGGITAMSDRLAVLLVGAGPDRILLVDPHNGSEAGTVALAR
jgi:hypothetical protein